MTATLEHRTVTAPHIDVLLDEGNSAPRLLRSHSLFDGPGEAVAVRVQRRHWVVRCPSGWVASQHHTLAGLAACGWEVAGFAGPNPDTARSDNPFDESDYRIRSLTGAVSAGEWLLVRVGPRLWAKIHIVGRQEYVLTDSLIGWHHEGFTIEFAPQVAL